MNIRDVGRRGLALASAWAFAVLPATVMCPGASRAQGVHVALTPAFLAVQPGDSLELDLTVTQAGSAFNGFDAYIGFDSLGLTILPTSPVSMQDGSLMSGACGNLFRDFHTTSDSAKCTLALLCSGITVTGPGQIYRLFFQASTDPQLTRVRFLPGLQFSNTGLYVNPDSSADAVVQIGSPSAVGPVTSEAAALRVRATPNPFRAGTAILVTSSVAGPQVLSVLDAQGRAVRRLGGGRFEAGARTVMWDGRADSGIRLPSGIYFAILAVPGRTTCTHIVLLR